MEDIKKEVIINDVCATIINRRECINLLSYSRKRIEYKRSRVR